ncbi:MAG: PqqD family protein [Acutalibacteraceae bacterium]|nr:PqqD family protein [Acutalibacteraceae bacterium]
MKIKSSFKLRKAAGENIVMVYGEEAKKYSGVIILNDTSAFLWSEIESKQSDKDALIKALKDEYNIDDDTAAKGVEKFINLITEQGFLE